MTGHLLPTDADDKTASDESNAGDKAASDESKADDKAASDESNPHLCSPLPQCSSRHV